MRVTIRLRRGALLCGLLFGACIRPVPDAPSVPPPPEPRREVNSATVHGRILSSSGFSVSHAAVVVHLADRDCRRLGPAVGSVTDESGEYLAVLESGVGPAHDGCLVVEASSGGATGSVVQEARFSSESPRARVDIALESGDRLDAQAAGMLVSRLVDAINDPASGSSDLELFVLHGPEALRVGLEQYRKTLGQVIRVQPLPPEAHDLARFRFELEGTTGETSIVDVHQEDLVRLLSPALDYGFRSERFVGLYLRAISTGDAERLARLLNPDDVEFPIERAREIVIAYRSRYRDLASIRPELAAIDESRNQILWRLRGTGPGGEEVTEVLELGFGDGLIGLRNPGP